MFDSRSDTQQGSPTCRTLLTADEVAAALKITPATVYRWAKAGRLERVALGGRLVRYTPESVERLIHPSTSDTAGISGGVAKIVGAGDDARSG